MTESLLVSPGGYHIRPLSAGAALVRSPEGKVYRVDTVAGTCACPASVFRDWECKHLVAVRNLLELLDWPEDES